MYLRIFLLTLHPNHVQCTMYKVQFAREDIIMDGFQLAKVMKYFQNTAFSHIKLMQSEKIR